MFSISVSPHTSNHHLSLTTFLCFYLGPFQLSSAQSSTTLFFSLFSTTLVQLYFSVYNIYSSNCLLLCLYSTCLYSTLLDMPPKLAEPKAPASSLSNLPAPSSSSTSTTPISDGKANDDGYAELEQRLLGRLEGVVGSVVQKALSKLPAVQGQGKGSASSSSSSSRGAGAGTSGGVDMLRQLSSAIGGGLVELVVQ
jgi:hypothetical protein